MKIYPHATYVPTYILHIYFGGKDLVQISYIPFNHAVWASAFRYSTVDGLGVLLAIDENDTEFKI